MNREWTFTFCTCGESLYSIRDMLRKATNYQHGENPEAVFVLTDVDMRISLEAFAPVHEWLDSIHNRKSIAQLLLEAELPINGEFRVLE